MKLSAYLWALVLPLLLVGCSQSTLPDNEPQRVLLVYMATDNNLAGYEQAKLDAIRQGWSGRAGDVILAYRDTRNTEPRLMELSNLRPGEPAREIARYSTENSASAQVWARVLRDVQTLYPHAQQVGLVVFSHASGWLPEGALLNPYGVVTPTAAATTAGVLPKSLMADGEQEMSLADFAEAIPNGMFDYMVFEMCFMAGIEVAYELRYKTDYILASSAEIVHPGFAPVYAAATPALLSGKVQEFAQCAFAQVLSYSPTVPQHSATYSVIRTTGLEPLAQYVQTNCRYSRGASLDTIQHFDRYAYHLFFDFEQYFAARLNSAAQCAQLHQLVQSCVVWQGYTPQFMTQQVADKGFVITHHSGLTTYAPQPAFAGLNKAYQSLQWARVTRLEN